MHLIKLTLLASLASVAFSYCVLNPDECPAGTHAQSEPEVCREMGFPPPYHLLCVGGDANARQRSLASVAFTDCVRDAKDCPPGTHAKIEPFLCRELGFPPPYHLLCVGDDVNARQGSLDRWFPRGSSRQVPLREPCAV
ncbi:hypothetical protein BGX27_000258 [Mortierella sp. AM989]|nr:hypothetical protein BGX27_000258 [Mortierella sp. AM989]